MDRTKSASKLSFFLYRGIWNGLDLLFPPVCGGCEKPGSRWCSDCQGKVSILRGPICNICGLPQKQAGICNLCRLDRPPYHSLRSWSIFEDPVRNALHRLKYRNDMGLGEALSVQMAEFVRELAWPIDVIVPVPLGKRRLRERGYNQVGLIARPMALSMNVDYLPRALTRQRETRSQVGLTRTQRHENVQGAFRAEGPWVKGKSVLVMDDVATTGSTLRSSAEAFYSSGATDVYALTVARALPQHMGHA